MVGMGEIAGEWSVVLERWLSAGEGCDVGGETMWRVVIENCDGEVFHRSVERQFSRDYFAFVFLNRWGCTARVLMRGWVLTVFDFSSWCYIFSHLR